ncbi:MAG: hypothetical protein IMW86_04760 [Hydrogenibacillus sp.]|nr:hypothetical protein [Hydrogenibacillus sp.]
MRVRSPGWWRASLTISVAFGCPFEGPVDEGRVVEWVRRAAEVGFDEIVLADTIGIADPRQVGRLVRRSREATEGRVPIGVHLHNTRNTGLANAYAALENGATTFDASVGGLGGCPFAPNATGNIATEDLVYIRRTLTERVFSRRRTPAGRQPAAHVRRCGVDIIGR